MGAAQKPAKSRKEHALAERAVTAGSTYRCFLLRCRFVPGATTSADGCAGPAPGWRFMVQEAGRDGERRSFACLSDFEAYLEAELESSDTFGATGGLP